MGLDMYLMRIPKAEDSVLKDIQIRLSRTVITRNFEEEKKKIEEQLGFPFGVKEWSWIDKDRYKYDLLNNPDDEALLIGGSPYSLEEEVGYWRKFNALHNWFVENVQGGVDECETYSVSKAQLEMLEITLEMVLDQRNMGEDAHKKLLPTQSGFFFGGTEYDSHYYKEVRRTLEILQEIKETGFDNYQILYRASW